MGKDGNQYRARRREFVCVDVFVFRCRALYRLGQQFPQYNIREYIFRRVRAGFAESAHQSQVDVVKSFERGQEDVKLLQRQLAVHSLYGSAMKSVLE